MVAHTAYGYDLELSLGIGRQAGAGVWDAGTWDTAVWAQPDTVLGDWVDVTCDVVDPFTLNAGTSEADGIATRWEAASCAFTLHGDAWDPWNGPYADLLGPELPVRWRWRVTPGPPVNQGPVAAFTFTTTGLTVDVVSTSTDPDGTVTGWGWTFGDGATATGPTASHTYASAGTRTVRLTVTDNAGATAAVSHAVTVAPPPALTPADLSGVFWIAAEDCGAAGTPVSTWVDRKGAHNVTADGPAATVSATETTPRGGRAVRLTDSPMHAQAVTMTGSGELWAVVRAIAGDAPAWAYGSVDVSYYPFQDGKHYENFGAAARYSYTPTLTPMSWHLLRMVHDSVAHTLTTWIDGVQQFQQTGVTTGWAPSLAVFLGWKGYAAELFLRPVVSTPVEATDLHTYFWNRHLAPSAAQQPAPRADPDGWEPLFLGRTIDAGWDWDPRTASAEVVASDATADLATFVGIKQAPAGAGETAAARVTRWLDYARWPTDRRDVTAGGVRLVATDMAGKAWEKLLTVADTDVAVLFVDRAGRLVYRPNGRTQVTTTPVVLVACPDPAHPDAVQVVDMGKAEPVPVVNIVSVRGGTPPDGDDPAYVTVTDEGSVSRYRAHRAGYDLEHDTTIAPAWSQTVAQLVTTSRAWPSAAPHTLTLGLVSGDARVPAVLFGLDPGEAFQVIDPGGRAWLTQVAGWDIQVGWDTCGGQLFVTDVTTWAGAWWDSAEWDSARWTL